MSPDTSRSYRLPLSLWLGVLRSIITGSPLQLSRMSANAFKRSGPRRKTIGAEHLPQSGACIIVGNHYQRPGLWVAWAAGSISAVVRRQINQEVHYIITSEFDRLAIGSLTFRNPLLGLTRRIFERIAACSGMVIMPHDPEDKTGRARAMRETAHLLDQQQVVGIFPEAEESVALREARPGSGGFVALLSRGSIPVIPAAIYEEDGMLITRFGAPFTLSNKRTPERNRDTHEADLRNTMMGHVARLLPADMRGSYAQMEQPAQYADQ